VIDLLAGTIIEHGITGYNYMHYGAEYVAAQSRKWVGRRGIAMVHTLNSHLYERRVSKSFG
jgi:hypothetical protein